MNKQNKLVIIKCCLVFGISGMTALSFGAILPELIQDCGLSFTVAGGLLSCMSLGNFAASFVYPFLSMKMKERYTAALVTLPNFIGLLAFTVTSDLTVLFVMAFLLGLNRGCISIVNNRVVNTVSHSSSKYLNLLHMSYAIGAFLSPFAIAMFARGGLEWKIIYRVMAVICLVCPWIYFTIGQDDTLFDNSCGRKERTAGTQSPRAYFKDAAYVISIIMLFCYVGLEYSVNGWFVTYLQSLGLMNETIATMMVSVTWFMMMIGRIIVAKCSGRFKTTTVLAVITGIQLIAVLLLILGNHAAVVLIAMMLLGLGLSGIYPCVMAFAGRIVGNSSVGIAFLTGTSAFGGILIPQLIGIIADCRGFSAAIITIVADSIAVLILGLVILIYFGTHCSKGEKE